MPLSPDAIDTMIPATGSMDIDHLWRAIRKVSNQDPMVVVSTLAKGDMTFRELQIATNLTVNNLNHILYDMRQLNLIIP